MDTILIFYFKFHKTTEIIQITNKPLNRLISAINANNKDKIKRIQISKTAGGYFEIGEYIAKTLQQRYNL